MLISVKILKGGECDIEVSATASINSVKQIVAEQLRIPVDQQKLVFKGKTLLDSETLCDYNIEEGNKIHLFVQEDVQEDTPTETIPEEPTPDFYDVLLKLLHKHFSPADAEKVLEEFRKNLADQLRHLSLDDIERIATIRLDSDSKKHSPPKSFTEENTPMQS
ncbi:ubiquitin-like protein 4A [Trichonephila inaurata madagascariensis]|uniref:Ubiquitin-like protein 4A n=1 Tax=Trichonephila inaurata madagascariensis TaxID=2747483 RepID=A0A8X6ILG2_9ARAC|nr:ubiquitin-like protein 4A [Trichonephila inaurata madagascariensis]